MVFKITVETDYNVNVFCKHAGGVCVTLNVTFYCDRTAVGLVTRGVYDCALICNGRSFRYIL